MYNNILDVEGLKVGQVENEKGLTGCTVVLCEEGATCGVDVRGAAPGTRETDLLDPINMVQMVHAVVLSGGSSFGLEASCGVSNYLEEHDIGFDVGVTKVPIVVGAVLFDLSVGDSKCRPDKKMGYKACEVATSKELKQGNYGAGCGATVGKSRGQEFSMRGGIGSHSIKLDNGLVVSAIVAVNAFGDIYEGGNIIAGVLDDDKKTKLNSYELMKKGVSSGGFSIDNTTIGVVATNAIFTKADCKKVSQMAHDGYARAIFPIHTQHDGDTIFTMSTGKIEADVTLVGSIAVEVVEKSIVNAVKNAKSSGSLVSYRDLENECASKNTKIKILK
ncbi:P1 family peptidase [Metaclostridioides mangenotii]|uniref:L-aminopeptidase/D-esterase-like protein n=1 Tax=Metaclostridioides mangenotii TaxID=1540 RepID=A0ABS4EDY2_9FIRM|nr:P1 family peptidase [Clostridioides mangenotii]MBP1856134.1 L-aminopeptidase/D-esterase-like protein [Clostridioides mangenotii]